MDQPKPPIDLKTTAGGLGSGVDLERTRLDINSPVSSELEVTRTGLEVVVEPEPDTPVEKTGITIRIQQIRLFEQIRHIFFGPKKKPSDSDRKPRRRLFQSKRWEGLWVAPSGLSTMRQLLFYASRFFMVVTGVAFGYLLVQSASATSFLVPWTRWLVWFSVGVAFLLPVVLVILRQSPAWLVSIPAAIFLVLLGIQNLWYRGAGTEFFSFLGGGPAFFYNHLWIAFFVVELGYLIFAYPKHWLAKIPMLVLIAYSLAGFVVNRLAGLPLESSWFGAGFLSGLPFYSIQPVIVALCLVVPLLTLFSTVFVLTPFRRSIGWGLIVSNLVLLVAAFFLSSVILYKNRVPSLATMLLGTPILSGAAEADDHGRAIRFELASGKVNEDRTDHAFMFLAPVQVKDSRRYYVSIVNQDGFPVFFIKRNEGRLFVDSKEITDFNFKVVSRAERRQTSHLPGQNGYWINAELPVAEVLETPDDNLAEVTKKKTHELSVLTPQEGDYFQDQLEVALEIPALAAVPGDSGVNFLLDGEVVATKSEAPYQVILPTTFLAAGPHLLTIAAGELSRDFHLVKGPGPTLALVQPSLGEFIDVVTPLELSVSGGSFQKIELLLDHEVIHEWTEGPYNWTWANDHLGPNKDLLLTIRGEASGGVKTSDWVRVSTGGGLFQVVPEKQERSPDDSFTYQKVVVILDASESARDGWNLRTKWRWQSQLFLDPDVLNKLKSSQAGVLVMGSRADSGQHDCHDADWSFNMATFDARATRAGLDKVEASGTAPLMTAITKAVEAHPDKIVLVTDGLDDCTPGLTKKVAALFETTPALMDVVALGPVSENFKKTLAALAEGGRGYFTEVRTGEALIKAVSDGLSFRYVLTAGGKTVGEGVLGSQDIPVRSGHYRVKLIMSPPLAETDLHVQHGFKTIFNLKSNEGKTEAVQETKPVP